MMQQETVNWLLKTRERKVKLVAFAERETPKDCFQSGQPNGGVNFLMAFFYFSTESFASPEQPYHILVNLDAF